MVSGNVEILVNLHSQFLYRIFRHRSKFIIVLNLGRLNAKTSRKNFSKMRMLSALSLLSQNILNESIWHQCHARRCKYII